VDSDHDVPSTEDLQQEFKSLNKISCTKRLTNLDEMMALYPTATRPENFQKNRYGDVLPEENHRVKLQVTGEESDYINASEVRPTDQSSGQHFICCQAPMPNTFCSFWRMIWEQACPVVVMLTKLVEGHRTKADPYWPTELDHPQKYGSVVVTMKSATQHSFIEERTFELSFGNQTREVIHLHYQEWPDFGAPDSTEKIRELIRLLEKNQSSGKSKGLVGPPIIHCSAGIGRTGAFITILFCLEKLRKGGSLRDLDVFGTVKHLREQRTGMVQTESQYVFIFHTLRDWMKDRDSNHKRPPSKSSPLLHRSADDILPTKRRCATVASSPTRSSSALPTTPLRTSIIPCSP